MKDLVPCSRTSWVRLLNSMRASMACQSITSTPRQRHTEPAPAVRPRVRPRSASRCLVTICLALPEKGWAFLLASFPRWWQRVLSDARAAPCRLSYPQARRHKGKLSFKTLPTTSSSSSSREGVTELGGTGERRSLGATSTAIKEASWTTRLELNCTSG